MLLGASELPPVYVVDEVRFAAETIERNLWYDHELLRSSILEVHTHKWR